MADVPDDLSRALRGAIWSGDPATCIAAASGRPTGMLLQLSGEALLLALRSDPAAADPARALIGELRDRDDAGDEELAAELEAGLGDGPLPLLRPLPVDLEDLTMVLEGDRMTTGGRIDLETGEVISDLVDRDSGL